MAALPLLLQAKAGVCSLKDFVEFISVSIIVLKYHPWKERAKHCLKAVSSSA